MIWRGGSCEGVQVQAMSQTFGQIQQLPGNGDKMSPLWAKERFAAEWPFTKIRLGFKNKINNDQIMIVILQESPRAPLDVFLTGFLFGFWKYI